MSAETLAALARLAASAFVVALSGAMAPGPFLTVTIAETCRAGRRAALMLLAGHALLEAALLVGFAFGLQALIARPAVSTALALAGGAFLLWMGAGLLAGAARGTLVLPRADDGAPLRFGPVLQGAAVSASNPYWTLWWATVGAKLAFDGLAIGPLGVVAFFIGHQLGDLAWYASVVQAVHAGRRLLSDATYRWVMAACGVLLVLLSLTFLRGGVTALLG